MAKLIRWNGPIEDLAPLNGSDFKFKGELYNILDTDMIELIHLANGDLMLIDEEGKLKDYKSEWVNPVATALLEEAGGIPGDYVIGDVVVCDDSQLR